VVAVGPLAARAARELLPELPLVYCMVPELADAGLQGAANTTGVAYFAPVRNQLAAFRAVNPSAKRIGLLVSAGAGERLAEEARKAGSGLGLEVVVAPVASPARVPQSVRDLLGATPPVDALWLLPDPILSDASARRFVLSTALEARKPVYGYSSGLVMEGALVSHAPELASIGQGAGELVGRILAGQKPERLPPVVPRSEVLINKKVADHLRLVLTPQVLQAARVF
jgi:putative ABC transport system substrate-binding protein